MTFTLRGEDFFEENPLLKIARFNTLAFVARIQRERPARILVTFDGSPDATKLLLAVAGDIGGY